MKLTRRPYPVSSPLPVHEPVRVQSRGPAKRIAERTGPPDTDVMVKPPDLTYHKPLNDAYEQIQGVVNGNLTFGTAASPADSNIQGMMLQAKAPSGANTDFVINHTLGYTPQYFHVTSLDKSAIVYKGVTPWTETQIYLRCSVAATNLSVFVH